MIAVREQSSRCILVVDDDKTFTSALATFLKGHGYPVMIANDATYAFQFVVQENIAMVILDLGLPGGGGVFVLENIRRIRKPAQLPIIVSTANVAPGVEKQVRDAGANAFIAKPYDLEKLLVIVRSFWK